MHVIYWWHTHDPKKDRGMGINKSRRHIAGFFFASFRGCRVAIRDARYLVQSTLVKCKILAYFSCCEKISPMKWGCPFLNWCKNNGSLSIHVSTIIQLNIIVKCNTKVNLLTGKLNYGEYVILTSRHNIVIVSKT